jgi:hypothetical protein
MPPSCSLSFSWQEQKADHAAFLCERFEVTALTGEAATEAAVVRLRRES